MTDRPLLVYVGYPNDLMREPPSWTSRIFRSAEEGDPFRFFVSGGIISDSTLLELQDRNVEKRLQRLVPLIKGTYSDRMLPSLIKDSPHQIARIASSGSTGSELRVLVDLWVLCRSDVYLTDCDLLSRGRMGMELLFASLLGVESVGVTDSAVQDPWAQYHLGRHVRPHDVLSHLWQIRDSLEVIEAKMAALESPLEEGEGGPEEPTL